MSRSTICNVKKVTMSIMAAPIEHRSLEGGDHSFVRFINMTDREVSVIWLDFDGNKIPYSALCSKEAFVDINTFVNHPWIFEDVSNGDRFVVDKTDVYYPKSWKSELKNMNPPPPRGQPIQPRRKELYITYPLYTLRDRALRAIRDCLENPEDSYKLDIPRSIGVDIHKLMLEKSKR